MAYIGGVEDGAHPGVRDDEEVEAEELPETEKERMAGGVDDAEVDEDEQILAAWPP
jgi:hypothetical protein